MIITTAIIKGGAGKTTTAAALAQYAVKCGKTCLAIDLDGQGNLTTMLNGHKQDGNSYALVVGKLPPEDCIQQTPQGVDLIAASADLSLLASSRGSALRLREALATVQKRYDLVVIDTPPSIGECALNAIMASDGLIIPLEADPSSAQGLSQAVELVRRVIKNANINIIGALITRYSGRSKVNQYLREKIEERAAALEVPFLGVIREGVAVKEAQLMQKNLFEYAPKSNPTQDYKKLFEKAGI